MSRSANNAEQREPHHRISVGRGEVAVWDQGEGKPVVLLHGFPDHALGMLSLAEALDGAGLRAVVPALPGYWPSSPVREGTYGIPEVTADIIHVLDAMEIDRPAVIGHDWGAEIAYHIGAHEPGRISSLVTLAAPHPAGYAVRRSVFSEQQTAWYAIFLAYAPLAASVAGNPTWLTGLAQSWSPGFHRRDWPGILDLLARPGVMEAVCGYYRADLDASLQLESVHVPTTIIHGGQDGCIRPIAYSDLERWFEHPLTVRLVPHVGHWPHLEDPDTVIPMILDALE